MGMGLYSAWRRWSVKTINQFIDRYDRIRLKNKDFTILCPNCIGGNIYHRLGLQFLTPTINMFMSQDDFIKVIKKPLYYLNGDLSFVSTNKGFPVAKIYDITINFNHDSVQEEAAEKWYRRRKRIRWDNLFVILYEEEPLSKKDILALSEIQCKRLVVLTSYKTHTDLPYVKYIKRHYGRPNEKHFLDRDYFNVQTFEKHFNFVAWLNGSKKY